MKYIVFDTETTTKESHKRRANVFDKDNFVVLTGWKYSEIPSFMPKDMPKDGYVYADYKEESTLAYLAMLLERCNPQYLVGFNTKFDVQWLWEFKEFQDWVARGGKIWDCMLVEYMLTGQDKQYPSLNYCAQLYGGTLKDDRIAALWAAGADTTEIPKDMLIEYNMMDVENTELVFLKQLEKLEADPDLTQLIIIHNDYLLATTEMERNGMFYSLEKANEFATNLEKLVDINTEDLDTIIAKRFGEDTEWINWDSPSHLSMILFGGTLMKDCQVQYDTFKTGERKGQPKFKKGKLAFQVPKLCNALQMWKTKKPGIFQTDDKVLELLRQGPNATVTKITELMLARRSYKKLLSTYLKGFLECLHDDGIIHQQLIHISTDTGRLSCKSPNVQNIPRVNKDLDMNIKDLFVSRHGDDGLIVEYDLDSAEIAGAAILSKDAVLAWDIMDTDLKAVGGLHAQSAAFALNKDIKDVTPEERQAAKTVNFGLLYGKSVQNLARDVFDGDKDRAQAFADSFYGRYTKVKQWQDTLVRKVQEGQYYEKERRENKEGDRLAVYLHKSLLGRRFLFKQNTSPDYLRKKGINVAFNPPDIKNYPVQALATADIAAIVFGGIFRQIQHKRHKFVMINTVHDSILFDCRKEHLRELDEDVKLIVGRLKGVLKDKFDVDLNVDMTLSMKAGSSWGTTREVSV